MPEPRKHQRRKEARPAEIIDAARATFIEQGFAAARVEDIAARAGVSKGTVYLYFPTKEALFEAVARATVLPVLDAVAAVLLADPTTPAPMQLRAILETIYRELVGTERRRLLHLIIAEGPRFPALTAFYHREILSKGRALLRGVIERGMARGEFRRDGLERHPEILVAPAIIAALWTLLFEAYEPLDVDSFRQVHLDLMLQALRPR